MIQMTCGACRVGTALKRAVDGPFSLDPASEERLVARGVAVYVVDLTDEVPADEPEGEAGEVFEGVPAAEPAPGKKSRKKTAAPPGLSAEDAVVV